MALSPTEDRYLSALTAAQFPDMPADEPAMPVEPEAMESSVDGMLLAAGPSQTMSDAGGGRGEMRAYDPTTRERLASFLQAGFEGMGIDRVRARRQAQTLIGGPSSNLPLSLGLADVLPLLGTGLQTEEAARMGGEAVASAQRGDMGTAAIQAGGAALGLVPGAVGTAKTAMAVGRAGERLAEKTVPQIMAKGGTMAELMQALSQGSRSQLIAYHGSPYEFNKFSAKKIGSGEGAQAYGFGMYFAEDKGVAQGYHTSLSMKVAHVDGKVPERNTLEWEAANSIASKGYDQALAQAKKSSEFRLVTPEGREKYQQLVKVIEGMKGRKVEDKASGGVYTVDIPDAMVSKMLDFDAPIGEQSPEIQALAKQYNLSIADLGGDLLAAADGKTPQGAQKLREAGVPGVRYLDQGSRSSKASTRNIVVFPGGEDQVKILKQEGKK